MTTIREILDSIGPQDRATLRYAFQNNIAQYVVLPDGRYLGVYAHRIPYLQQDPQLTVEPWSVGIVRGPENNDPNQWKE